MQSLLVNAAVEERPAGGAALDQVLIATGFAVVLSVALGAVVLLYRAGRLRALDRVLARIDRSPRHAGLRAWASVPLGVAMISLITALLGMYWDISLHIGVGRDEGPLANPAHYPIMFGLFGIAAAGVLACALPKPGEAGPSAVRLTPQWDAPAGGLLLTGAGSYALLGFPLDDVWHRIFGQDVTLWGPTHLMLIGGAGLSLVAMAVLFQEGRTSSTPDARVSEYLLKSFLVGGLLIGLSVFQAEFDFGVPQFRLVLQPLMIAVAATFSLVVARLWVGRGGALMAVGFYVVVRGGVSVVVGAVFGELWAAIPLYVAEALIVELVALRWARRPIAAGVVSGVLIGTVGLAAEFAWTQVAFRLPWTSDIVVEAVLMATLGGAAAGLLAGLFVRGLRRDLPDALRPRLLLALGLAALAGCTVNGVLATVPSGVETRATILSDRDGPDGREIEAEFALDPDAVEGEPAWVQVTSWQGGAESEGLYVDRLESRGDGRWRTTEPVPVSGSWKTLLRVHDGRDLAAAPVFMPEDRALDEPEIPVSDEARALGPEDVLLQRELKDDTPGWVWLLAGLVVLVCSLALLVALGWGVRRYATASAPEVGAERGIPVGT